VLRNVAKCGSVICKSLVISDCRKFDLCQSRFSLLTSRLPNLTHLTLLGNYRCVLHLPIGSLPNLTHFTTSALDIFRRQPYDGGQAIQVDGFLGILEGASQSLEHLNVWRPGGDASTCRFNPWPELPKLKSLRVRGRSTPTARSLAEIDSNVSIVSYAHAKETGIQMHISLTCFTALGVPEDAKLAAALVRWLDDGSVPRNSSSRVLLAAA
jgi:hypothetical protein